MRVFFSIHRVDTTCAPTSQPCYEWREVDYYEFMMLEVEINFHQGFSEYTYEGESKLANEK